MICAHLKHFDGLWNGEYWRVCLECGMSCQQPAMVEGERIYHWVDDPKRHREALEAAARVEGLTMQFPFPGTVW